MNHNEDRDDWRGRLDCSNKYLQTLGTNFSEIEQRLTHAAKLASDDLNKIEMKENHINVLFRDPINEYKKANSRLKLLEASKEAHVKKSEELSKALKEMTANVAAVKKKIDLKGSSITDSSPLVEIRAALQRLKTENKEFDLRIGILVSYNDSSCTLYDENTDTCIYFV